MAVDSPKTQIKVDPSKSRTVLVIHGVQLGDETGLNQHKLISQLISHRLGNIPLQFNTDIYRYENINDQAQKNYRRLTQLILPTPFGTSLATIALELIGDVVISRQDTSTAAQIRKGFREKILQIFEQGNPCYIVAHSLGTIYAFDVLYELMQDPQLFARHSRRSWPVQGLITLGSPIGLSMFARNRQQVSALGIGTKWFRWLNYWDRNDPVVSGKILGQALNSFAIAEHYLDGTQEQGWVIRDIAVDTGKIWLAAHVAYWDNPVVGDGLVDLITH